MFARRAAREVEAVAGKVTLEPRVMQVLVALARQSGSVVSRDELIGGMKADGYGFVSMDEAIEIAKRYGSKDSAPFVNGVLDQVASSGSSKAQ